MKRLYRLVIKRMKPDKWYYFFKWLDKKLKRL